MSVMLKGVGFIELPDSLSVEGFNLLIRGELDRILNTTDDLSQDDIIKTIFFLTDILQLNGTSVLWLHIDTKFRIADKIESLKAAQQWRWDLNKTGE